MQADNHLEDDRSLQGDCGKKRGNRQCLEKALPYTQAQVSIFTSSNGPVVKRPRRADRAATGAPRSRSARGSTDSFGTSRVPVEGHKSVVFGRQRVPTVRLLGSSDPDRPG